MKPADRLIVALDVNSADKAEALAEKLKHDVKFFKIGLELFTSCGPSIVKTIKEKGCGVFLDLKFHDIPNTVARALSSVTSLEPHILNVHAMGGYDMMRSAADAVKSESDRLGIPKPILLAVTILTSLGGKELKEVGLNLDPKEEVLRLARLTKKAGLDGVVASPSETRAIREEMGAEFKIVTPGVRPQWSGSHDQKRIASPETAIKDGADYIVVGRPITESTDPIAAAREIMKEMMR